MEYEKAKHELLLFNEQVEQAQSSKTSMIFQITLPLPVHTLINAQIRQQLQERQQRIILQYQRKLKRLYQGVLERRCEELKNAFHQHMTQYKAYQQQYDADLHFTPAMLTLIDQKLALITTKIAAIYQDKKQHSLITTTMDP